MAPHIKALFQGLDLTIFAYGVTGTGKTHTMRGGLRLADRGVIPRLLSNVFRRGKKIMKDTGGATTVRVSLSYYEIYNDRVYDLLAPPERRTPAGLPLREKDGKTVVVGLSERACEDLGDFERLYIEANNHRVTAATKLNAHSSRSHAILRVKVTQTTGGGAVRVSTASAIDLAGSEDNRRTDNSRERLVESAAINKSLFVLSQCIDAISRGDKRVPYRESKMTRILSLGQNNGITIMILNLAPVRSYHLDTLSSLNVSSRAKRIEAREIENEVVFKQPPRGASALQRQPLRPLTSAHNAHTGALLAARAAEKQKAEKTDRPVKAFSVYSDKKPSLPITTKKQSGAPDVAPSRPKHTTMSAAQIEAMVEKKVAEMLESRAAAVAAAANAATAAPVPQQPAPAQGEMSEEVRRRLEALERRVVESEALGDGARSEGLRLLLRARQAKEGGDDEAALRFYEAALPFFPGQPRLLGKIERLRAKLGLTERGGGEKVQKEEGDVSSTTTTTSSSSKKKPSRAGRTAKTRTDDDEGDDHHDDHSDSGKPPRAKSSRKKTSSSSSSSSTSKTKAQHDNNNNDDDDDDDTPPSPRARLLLDIVNSRDPARIRGLRGVGAKRAQDLVDCLARSDRPVASLAQLRTLPGMGGRAVERACEGLVVPDGLR